MTGDGSERTDEIHAILGSGLQSELASRTVTAAEVADALSCEAVADEAVEASITELAEVVTGDYSDASVEDRATATDVLATVASRQSERAPRVVSTLQDCLDDPVTETIALRGLATVASGAPATVDPALEAVGRRLTDSPLPARQGAVQVLEARADVDPGAVGAIAAPLVTAVASVDTGSSGTDLPVHRQSRQRTENVAEERFRQRAASVLEAVATATPAAVSPELGRLQRVLDPDVARNAHLREQVAEIVRLVAVESPDTAVELTPSLVALVERSNGPDSLRGAAAGALAIIADANPEETTEQVRTAVGSLAQLSSHESPVVRARTTSLLSSVAQHHPDSLTPATAPLLDRLDDDHVPVRAAAVWAVAALDTDQSRTALAETASNDPDPDVRALASELHALDETE